MLLKGGSFSREPVPIEFRVCCNVIASNNCVSFGLYFALNYGLMSGLKGPDKSALCLSQNTTEF